MSDWWSRIRELEPARVRAVWAAVVALALALGVTIREDIDGAVQALIVAVFTLLPLIQGEATRERVVPVAKADRAARKAGETIDRLWEDTNPNPDDDDMTPLGGE